MYTQCTQCQTYFRISSEQISMAKGKVRCGHCSHVFDARGTLQGILPKEALEPKADEQLDLVTDITEQTKPDDFAHIDITDINDPAIIESDTSGSDDAPQAQANITEPPLESPVESQLETYNDLITAKILDDTAPNDNGSEDEGHYTDAFPDSHDDLIPDEPILGHEASGEQDASGNTSIDAIFDELDKQLTMIGSEPNTAIPLKQIPDNDPLISDLLETFRKKAKQSEKNLAAKEKQREILHNDEVLQEELNITSDSEEEGVSDEQTAPPQDIDADTATEPDSLEADQTELDANQVELIELSFDANEDEEIQEVFIDELLFGQDPHEEPVELKSDAEPDADAGIETEPQKVEDEILIDDEVLVEEEDVQEEPSADKTDDVPNDPEPIEATPDSTGSEIAEEASIEKEKPIDAEAFVENKDITDDAPVEAATDSVESGEEAEDEKTGDEEIEHIVLEDDSITEDDAASQESTDEPSSAHVDAIPYQLRDSLQAAQKLKKGPVGMGLGLLSIVALTLLLTSQAIVFRNAEIVYQFPATHRFITLSCRHLPCQPSGRRAIDKMQLISRDVRSHPKAKGALLISAAMVNQAKFAQPYPDILITLSDITGAVVVRRRFGPKYYLGKLYQPYKLMASGTPLHIAFEVLDPGSDAINFEFTFL